MKVYNSISPMNNHHPYIFKETSQKIYSFEGLAYYCFNHWMEAIEVIVTEGFKRFISETLMLNKEPHNITSLLEEECKASKKLIRLLEHSQLFSTDELDAIYEKVTQWEAQPLQTRYKTLGDQNFALKKYVKAIEYYKLAQSYSFDVVVEHNMGIAYLKLYFYNEAEKSLIRAALESQKAEIQLSLIRLLKITNRINEALIKAERLRETSKNIDVIMECGLLYKLQGQFKEAYPAFLEAYELDKREEIRTELLETALEISLDHPILSELENMPKNEDYYLIKSKIFLKENRLEEAIELLEEGVVQVEDNSKLYVNLSKLYRKNKQIIKAIGAISQAAKDKPQDDEIIFEMARIAKRAGNWTDYEAKIDELLKLWKNDVRRRFS